MDGAQLHSPALSGGKFRHPDTTADGSPRAHVPLTHLETLWINTGTLCNVECTHCYIESSPRNDRLSYITAKEAGPFLQEAQNLSVREIGFTGGEPFLNPDTPAMIESALARGFDVLVLTNAMRPMMRAHVQEKLLAIKALYGRKLTLRVSIDHYTRKGHDEERGHGAFDATMKGAAWLAENGFHLTVAARNLYYEDEFANRRGFRALFEKEAIPLDADDPEQLVIFPEMDATQDAPEITTDCWRILGKDPGDVMCATSRMLVKRKGALAPVVLSCTLLPYDTQFEMGATLAEASSPVKLNHPFCAQFCVLGGASCSG